MFPLGIAAAGLVTAVVANTLFGGPSNTTRIKGPDGHEYEMQNLPDKEEAVKLMASIRSKLEKLYQHYKQDIALSQDPPVARFLARYSSEAFIENDMRSQDTSYSENKGQRIVVCLRDKTKSPHYPLIDENTIMFVLLHEMAHLMTETIGHTSEFWTNFKRILGDAVQIGIYAPTNYSQRPTPYCGMMITSSPIS
jgi:predicted metal-dependent hydrolase